MDIKQAYRALRMPLSSYVLRIALPIIAVGGVIAAELLWGFPQFFPGAKAAIPLVVPLFCVLVAVLYPLIVAERKKNDINDNMPLGITHLGILASSCLPLDRMVESIAGMKEYGELAKEIERVRILTTQWHLSFDDACRVVARDTPSKILSQFLERLAHAVGTSEDLTKFLTHEQEAVMREYATIYHGAVDALDLLRDSFTGMISSIAFLLVLAALLPMLTTYSAATILPLSVGLLVVTEAIFVWAITTVLPRDDLWHRLKLWTDARKKNAWAHITTIVLCILIAALCLLEVPLSPAIAPLILAASLTPLFIPGLLAWDEEKRLKARDDRFAPFVRSLGSAAVRGGATEGALNVLRKQEFGPLTKQIESLYRRIHVRMDETASWQRFGAESESGLIVRFTNTFAGTLQTGGNLLVSSSLISDNFIRMESLRKRRWGSASVFTSILYGMGAALMAVFFIGVGILRFFEQVFPVQTVGLGLPPTTAQVSGALLGVLGLVVIFSYALTSATMVRISTGGHPYITYLHMVPMLWIGAIIAIGLDKAMGYLLG